MCVSVLQCNMPMYPFHLFRTRAKKAPNTKHQNGRLGRLGSDRACLPGNRVQGAGNLFLGRIGKVGTVRFPMSWTWVVRLQYMYLVH